LSSPLFLLRLSNFGAGESAAGETSNSIETYVDILCQEIAATPAEGAPLQTVFFGGGTPSLLSEAQLKRVLKQLAQHFQIASDAEISMEMDPGTFSFEHLKGYLEAGITRISLGVQALEDDLLVQCGRLHRVADAYQAVEWLHQVEMSNWSLDLISGLPGQSLARWEWGLAEAVSLEPQHLSIYDLTIEPQTVFGKRYQPGTSPLPTDTQTSDMYRLAQRYLTDRGYEHYEISNYALPGHQCRHNLTYWRNQPYYGFGMGATSYTRYQRFSRPRTLQTYTRWVEEFQAAQGKISAPVTPPVEQLLDCLMVGLRLQEGVSGSKLQSLCNQTLWAKLYKQLQPHRLAGWLRIDSSSSATAEPGSISQSEAVPGLETLQRLRLTDPEGFLFSNVVLVTCFESLADFVPGE
jgi:putative oxygen-independent coproporphyrinogen III oxidase